MAQPGTASPTVAEQLDPLVKIIDMVRKGTATTRPAIGQASGLGRSIVTQRVEQAIELGLLDDTEALRRAYAHVCVTLGRTVDVHLPGGDVRRGEALDIDATGALVVGTDDGTFTVAAGDVVHVRPA